MSNTNPKFIDMTGMDIGKLKVLCLNGTNTSKEALWKCQCDCGNLTFPSGCDLRSGKINACEVCRGEEKRRKKASGQMVTSPKRYGKVTNEAVDEAIKLCVENAMSMSKACIAVGAKRGLPWREIQERIAYRNIVQERIAYRNIVIASDPPSLPPVPEDIAKDVVTVVKQEEPTPVAEARNAVIRLLSEISERTKASNEILEELLDVMVNGRIRIKSGAA